MMAADALAVSPPSCAACKFTYGFIKIRRTLHRMREIPWFEDASLGVSVRNGVVAKFIAGLTSRNFICKNVIH